MSENFDKEPEQEITEKIPGHEWFFLSLTSAAVYLLLAYLIFYFFHESGLGEAFDHGTSYFNQLVAGIASGCVGAGIIGFIMRRPPVSEILYDFYIVKMIANVRLTAFDRTQLSLFAGAGEELLFRGAIQPLIGIWLTSLIFVGLHGYFKFKSLGHFVFGAMMFGLSVGLGYIYEYIGLIAAISAHAVYDMIMLYWVQKK